MFYFEGLGFTRDPFFNVGASTMWCNVGYQQLHLSPGCTPPFLSLSLHRVLKLVGHCREPQVVRGHIGLVVPSLDDLKKRLVQPKVPTRRACCCASTGSLQSPVPQVVDGLQGTKFSWSVHAAGDDGTPCQMHREDPR